jgi:AraC-like DNA-binding protein
VSYDRSSLARLVDEMLRSGNPSLGQVCEKMNVHRHTIDRALHHEFACCFEQLRAVRQVERLRALTKDRVLSGKELAAALGYSSSSSAKRRIKDLAATSK